MLTNNSGIHSTWIVVVLFLIQFSGCSPMQVISDRSANGSSSSVSQHSYGSQDRQQLDIYEPEKINENSPVILFFYGGSWKRGEKEKYGFIGHRLSGMGYVTVIPDYRLYPEVRFPLFVEDGALAISWLRQNIDQAKHGVVVMGHSAGAHIAALLALDARYLDSVGQSQSVIRGMIGLAGPYGFDPLRYRSTRPIFSGTTSVEETKPVNFACFSMAPLLLLHGKDDGVVIAQNSRELSSRIKECGGNVEYIEFDEMSHMAIVLGLSGSIFSSQAVLTPIEMFLHNIQRRQYSSG